MPGRPPPSFRRPGRRRLRFRSAEPHHHLDGLVRQPGQIELVVGAQAEERNDEDLPVAVPPENDVVPLFREDLSGKAASVGADDAAPQGELARGPGFGRLPHGLGFRGLGPVAAKVRKQGLLQRHFPIVVRERVERHLARPGGGRVPTRIRQTRFAARQDQQAAQGRQRRRSPQQDGQRAEGDGAGPGGRGGLSGKVVFHGSRGDGWIPSFIAGIRPICQEDRGMVARFSNARSSDG